MGNKKQTNLKQFFISKSSHNQEQNTSHNQEQNNEKEKAFISELTPYEVEYRIGDGNDFNINHDMEGRVISVKFPLFDLVNVYVPNSAEQLKRLDYRINQWDEDFVTYINNKKRPVIWFGDLNVAYEAKDTWNEGAKHLAKQAGTTPEERDSFQKQLNRGPYADAFRFLHPNAWGQYTYWSTRANNRPSNKGLRLDYFICSHSLLPEKENKSQSRCFIRDSYML